MKKLPKFETIYELYAVLRENIEDKELCIRLLRKLIIDIRIDTYKRIEKLQSRGNHDTKEDIQ